MIRFANPASSCADLRLKSQAGFSMLEALVALAIIGTALLPLYALQQRITQQAIRLEAESRLNMWWRDALPELTSLNPMIRCEGESDYGAFVLVWSCTPLGPVTRNRIDASPQIVVARMRQGVPREAAFAPLPGPFELALYRVEAQLMPAGQSEAEAERTLTVLGYRRLVPLQGLGAIRN